MFLLLFHFIFHSLGGSSPLAMERKHSDWPSQLGNVAPPTTQMEESDPKKGWGQGRATRDYKACWHCRGILDCSGWKIEVGVRPTKLSEVPGFKSKADARPFLGSVQSRCGARMNRRDLKNIIKNTSLYVELHWLRKGSHQQTKDIIGERDKFSQLYLLCQPLLLKSLSN